MADWPRISVVTPSYNQAQYLEATIQSVLEQGYPSLDYAIVDGGSDDGSVEIIRRHERHLAWWTSERDRGQSHAINKGLARITGDVFVWLNSDDVFLPNALRLVGEALRDPRTHLLCGRCRYIDEAGAPLYDFPDMPLDLMHVVSNNGIPQPSVFVRRDVTDRIGTFREDMHFAFDYNYWVRCLLAGYEFAKLTEFLSLYRLHDTTKTVTSRHRLDLDMATTHQLVLESLRDRPDERRRARRAAAEFYRRVSFEHYAWNRDFGNSLGFFRRMLRMDARAADLRSLKIAVKAALRIPPPDATL